MAFSFDPDRVTLDARHYIGGQEIAGSGDIDLTRPSDGEVIATCLIADAGLVDQAVTTAQEALKTSGWSGCHPRDRVRCLHAWADLVEAHAMELGRIWSSPTEVVLRYV